MQIERRSLVASRLGPSEGVLSNLRRNTLAYDFGLDGLGYWGLDVIDMTRSIEHQVEFPAGRFVWRCSEQLVRTILVCLKLLFRTGAWCIPLLNLLRYCHAWL